MIELNTERLKIICLDLENFYLYIHDHGQMQRNIEVNVTLEALDQELQKVFIPVCEAALQDSLHYAWYTVWQVVLKQENCIVGGICFKGPPNLQGEVEIGYGTEPDYQNRGIMTEAVGAIIRWALRQAGVLSVIAETEKNNIASHRILVKNGMAVYQETDDGLWWSCSN